jgi:hypothetical protein
VLLKWLKDRPLRNKNDFLILEASKWRDISVDAEKLVFNIEKMTKKNKIAHKRIAQMIS